MENLQKVLKIKFQLKIDIPCQKDHKSRLKSRYWDRTPHPPFGGEGGVKTPQNTDFGNFRVILPLPAILQAKMNATIVFSVKKSFKIQVFIMLTEKVVIFVELCYWFKLQAVYWLKMLVGH